MEGIEIIIFFAMLGSLLVGAVLGRAWWHKRHNKSREAAEVQGEFVSLASHQMRTPLTKIHWQLDSLLDETQLTSHQRQTLQDVLKHAEGMAELIHDLLDVSRLETGRMNIQLEPLNLEELVTDVIDEVRTGKKDNSEGIVFKKMVTSKGVKADKSLVRQVILNFLTNAVRYSRPEQGAIEVRLESSASGYRVSVQDHGIGIPKDVQPRIFQKGFRADNAVRVVSDGTGLGLFLAQKIIEALGGTIGFTTEEGVGSTFWFELPKR
ncbi:MAG: HAMP domain-containing sensor histidine kinase [Patescibacteria group bacterium]